MKNGQSDKPAWLRKLEEESWQAELVISGVAIFGSLQLPDLIDHAAGWSYGVFSSRANFTLNLFFTYSFFGAYSLIVSFVLHFIMRTLWIGLVGLNSVYPEGISPAQSNYSPHFIKRLKNEMSFGNDPIQTLDDLCSLAFSLAANLVMVFVAIIVDVLIGFLLWSFLGSIFSEDVATVVIIVLAAVAILSAMIALSLNSKKLRDTAFAKKWHFPLFAFSSKMIMHIFYRPVNLLTFTYSTNIELRKYYLWSGMAMAVLMFLTVSRLATSSAVYYGRKDAMELMYNRTDRIRPENYENLRVPEHGYIISTVIESDRISGPFMRVFVPVFRSEDEWLEMTCGEYESAEGMSRDEERPLRQKFKINCLEKVHRFYVNGNLYDLSVHSFEHSNLGEDGIIVYIPTSNFKFGENILKVEKWGADSIYRTMQIPFLYEGKAK